MKHTLDEKEVPSSPIDQFRDWMGDAMNAGLPEPGAMTLATVSVTGLPSARIVLLKHVDEEGFIFYTNYRSRKGKDLESNPRAAVVFYWATLSRQVRVEGEIRKLTSIESDEYFQTRPRASQISAVISPQSDAIESRDELLGRVDAYASQMEGKRIPCPDSWGGYRLVPASIEFWQGREDRLHDRILYSYESGRKWIVRRLAP